MEKGKLDAIKFHLGATSLCAAPNCWQVLYIYIVLGESSVTPFAFGSPLREIRLSELIRLPLSQSPLMTIIYESTCHAFVVNYHFKHNGKLDLIYGLRWHHDSPNLAVKMLVCRFVSSASHLTSACRDLRTGMQSIPAESASSTDCCLCVCVRV